MTMHYRGADVRSCPCCVDDVVRRAADPTHTLPLRKSFATNFSRRFTQLKASVRDFISLRDQLGLNGPSPGSVASGGPQHRINTFALWFGRALEATVVSDPRWLNPYVQAGYNQGARDAADRMGRGVLSVPPDRPAALCRLAQSELQGISDELLKQATRVVAGGLLNKERARKVSAEVVDRIRAVGEVRSRALVNATVVSAHAYGSLEQYGAAGLTQVGVRAEAVPAVNLRDAPAKRRKVGKRTRRGSASPSSGASTLVAIATAGDELVCPLCEDLEAGSPYSIAAALGMIPAHPNCRCAWIPWGAGDPLVDHK